MCFLFMGWPPDLCLEALSHTPMVVPIQAAMGWYPFRRSRLVYIQAATRGTHTGGYARYPIQAIILVYISTINDSFIRPLA